MLKGSLPSSGTVIGSFPCEEPTDHSVDDELSETSSPELTGGCGVLPEAVSELFGGVGSLSGTAAELTGVIVELTVDDVTELSGELSVELIVELTGEFSEE